MKYEFVSNTNFENNKSLYKHIEDGFQNAIEFYFSVAFINFAGVQILLDVLKKTEKLNIKGKILTTNYLHFTELKAVDYLKKFKNIEVKFFDSDVLEGFHTKGYIFKYSDSWKAIIGSSNLTKSGLKSNVEWNISVTTSQNSEFITEVLNEFNYLWGKAVEDIKPYSVSSIKKLAKKIEKIPRDEYLMVSEDSDFRIYENEIKPNYLQDLAIKNLEILREYGEKRALCIAATGTGKTYLAAFHVKKINPNRVLFVVHNEEILNSAIETFKKIIKNKTMGKFTGNYKNTDRDYIFATIQTLNTKFNQFKINEFDYIIVDEAHHVTAESYSSILNYFKPDFLIGLTATPERCDGGNIYEVFDMNVPVDIRLEEALDRKLVVPFHYYGVKDIDVDFSKVDFNNISEVAKSLSTEKRVDFIIEKMNFYGYSGENRKTIGFCITVEHAEFMVKEFRKRGIKATSLTGTDKKELREKIIKTFKTSDSIEVIFTVNLFNEGVDIPCINNILMLRPTASPIVFTQQLGRGLRHFENKEFLTVIDFIGNHSRAFLIAIALAGKKSYDKESLKIALKRDFDNLSKNIHVKIDEICKKEILEQLNNENFNSLKYLKLEYKEFKEILKKRPMPINFTQYEEAPRFFKYAKLQKSYFDFLEKIGEEPFKLKEIQKNVIREFERFLPIKRVYEFVIAHEIISKKCSLIEADILKLVGKYIEIENLEHTKKTIKHAIDYLSGDYSDSQDLKRCSPLFLKSENGLEMSSILKKTLESEDVKKYILEVLDYGLLKYKENFNTKDYGFPFFKLYESYNMRDVALLCNYDMKHSAFRGSGLLKKDNDYFVFVDLHKDENIKESIKYNDKILDRYHFQWESPNATRIDSEIGKKIVKNKSYGIKIHIFLRKIKKIDSEIQQYIYIGKGDTVNYSGTKPIQTKLKLETPLSKEIYVELTERVEEYLEVVEESVIYRREI
ncbi:DEAD/DEAH box helicase [Cetobacterium sp.]|uniref:DEAD/DEAH box helicase n=1 Tax=Cetobacterium sp. TaxID=2071632 RepID=UPI003F3A4AB9